MVPLDLLVTVARALVEVGVVTPQGSLAEGGDLAQPRHPQQSPDNTRTVSRCDSSDLDTGCPSKKFTKKNVHFTGFGVQFCILKDTLSSILMVTSNHIFIHFK